MTQNLVSTHLGTEQWAQLDAALDGAETALSPMLVSLDVKERQRMVKMGDGSEAFCRASLGVLDNNMHLMPRSFDIDEMRRDLVSHDALNQRILRLTRLLEKMHHTDGPRQRRDGRRPGGLQGPQGHRQGAGDRGPATPAGRKVRG